MCINHFLINDDWHLVDLPGYGFVPCFLFPNIVSLIPNSPAFSHGPQPAGSHAAARAGQQPPPQLVLSCNAAVVANLPSSESPAVFCIAHELTLPSPRL